MLTITQKMSAARESIIELTGYVEKLNEIIRTALPEDYRRCSPALVARMKTMEAYVSLHSFGQSVLSLIDQRNRQGPNQPAEPEYRDLLPAVLQGG